LAVSRQNVVGFRAPADKKGAVHAFTGLLLPGSEAAKKARQRPFGPFPRPVSNRLIYTRFLRLEHFEASRIHYPQDQLVVRAKEQVNRGMVENMVKLASMPSWWFYR
jgi:hypothetical protein